MAHKAIGLFSGGLDSILAVRLILAQGIEVLGLHFTTPFYPSQDVEKIAQEIGLSIRIIPLGREYIEMLKKPKYGYGKNFNPCLDCRILTFSKARETMLEEEAEFVFSGEVLGERPFSQNRWAMGVVEKESGLKGLLLRPLSAKLLSPTKPELEGIVDREKLLAIGGRSRRPQMALAERFGIKKYLTPSGGCLLTYKEFAQKVKDALSFGEDSLLDMELLKYGRHFRLSTGAKVIVGRDEEENKILLAKNGEGIILRVKDFLGPVTLLRNIKEIKDLEIAARLTARYSDGKNEMEVIVIYDDKEIKVKPFSPEEVKSLLAVSLRCSERTP